MGATLNIMAIVSRRNVARWRHRRASGGRVPTLSTVVGAVPRCHPPNRAKQHSAESRSHSEHPPTRYAVRASRRASSGLSPAASNCGTERSKAARRRSIRRDRRRPRRGVESSRRKRRSQATTRADSLPDPRDGQRRPSLTGTRSVAGVTVARSGLSVGAAIGKRLRVLSHPGDEAREA